MNVSVIFPILNEEQGIKKTLTSTTSKLATVVTHFEIIAVNDGSSDKTAEILEKLAKENKFIKIVTHKKNLGYGAALKSGVKAAKYEWVFFTDADMQFDIVELQKFLPNTKQYDFIVGYRIKRADPLRRILVSFFYNRTIRVIFGLQLQDVDCAFKLMRKSAIEKIHLSSHSFFVSVELMVKAFKKKYSIMEIGVKHYPRIKGNSKVTTRQVVRTLIDLFSLYRSLTS